MSTKTVYLFDGETGAYQGTYLAQESVLDAPGVFIEPTNSTDIAPPSVTENEVAVYVSGAWSIQSDYRGQTIYNQTTGASEVVTVVGALPAGWALTALPATLAQAQAAQVAALAAAYNAAISTPVSFTTAGGVTKTFQADSNSQNLLVTAVAGYNAQKSVPSGFYWKSVDNTQVPFTLADLNGLSAAMLAQGWTAFQQLTTLKAQVAAVTTVDAVQAIVW